MDAANSSNNLSNLSTPTKIQAIQNLLPHITHEDLTRLYTPGMEVQITVAQDNGIQIQQEYMGKNYIAYTDNSTTWKPFRIPWNAATKPEYEDRPITFDLAVHYEGIGMTGWNWQLKRSIYVAFDFDSITGHKTGLSQVELENVKQIAWDVPWVTVRRSTSGTGYHFYVFLDPVETWNHNEHAAVARAVLAKLSSITGYDFKSKVDTCGGNMWIAHRKMNYQGVDTEGLKLIKQGSVLTEIPVNWRDHLPVVTRKSHKVKLEVEGANADDLDKLMSQRLYVPLDDEHLQIIKELEGTDSWWDQDHHLLVSHTWTLAQLHEKLMLRGIFRTIATGKELGQDHNCLSGATEILTSTGPRKIKDCVGENIHVLSRNTCGQYVWVTGTVNSFGTQTTYPLFIGNHASIRVTKQHQWITKPQHGKIDIYNKKYTSALRKGNLIPYSTQTLPSPDIEGIAHGFTFGNGNSVYRNKRVSCDAPMYRTKAELIPILKNFGIIGYQMDSSGTAIPVARNLPEHWKSVPQIANISREYACGFIAGLIAADGSVRADIRIVLSDLPALHAIRDLAIYAGFRVRNIYVHSTGPKNLDVFPTEKQAYVLPIASYNLETKHLLRSDHRSKIKIVQAECSEVVNYDLTKPKEEEVFCVTVPSYHNFTLANGLLTGNCYLVPIRNGGWIVRRFTQNCVEDPLWFADKNGWVSCYYNRHPDLSTVARAYGGVEREKGGYMFSEASVAIEALGLLGTHMTIPPRFLGRQTIVKDGKDGRIIVKIKHEASDNGNGMEEWVVEVKYWTRIFNAPLKATIEIEVTDYDQIVRHLVTANGEDAGWVLKSEDKWHTEPLIHVKLGLGSLGFSQQECNAITGSNITKSWHLTMQPFAPEYPGNRQWNRRAPQLMFIPKEERDALHYPTWNSILEHCSKNLQEAVNNSTWCIQNGIRTGKDYLKCWCASLFQEPLQPLPYLFFFGPQNCGKSIFHECLSMLFNPGYVRADAALINPSGFNGELENAVLCVVEETNLHANKIAYSRIKDWVTSIRLPLHPKMKTPINIVNTTHWVQTANEERACPVFPGDTRIVIIQVDPLKQIIPRRQLLEQLTLEAPDFLAALLALELPTTNDRLNIPVIMTRAKQAVEESNKTELEVFIEDNIHYVPGCMVLLADFYTRFMETLEGSQVMRWSKPRVSREMPQDRFPKGRRNDASWCFGNMSFTKRDPVGPILYRPLDSEFLTPFIRSVEKSNADNSDNLAHATTGHKS